jgi:hypothetical protein
MRASSPVGENAVRRLVRLDRIGGRELYRAGATIVNAADRGWMAAHG